MGVTIKITNKDQTAQVVNCSDKVLVDQKNNRLSTMNLITKIREIAMDIAKTNYESHKFILQY